MSIKTLFRLLCAAAAAMLLSPMVPGSVGDYFWGGGASTAFWIDPAEDLIVVFMTQLLPSTSYQVRRDLRQWVYGAMRDTGAAKGVCE